MEALISTYIILFLFLSLFPLILAIVILIRWWKMTTDIKEIRKLLINQVKETPVTEVQTKVSTDTEEINEIEILKQKLKPNQCIIRIKSNSMLEIWNQSDWNEHVKTGRSINFDLMYKNF